MPKIEQDSYLNKVKSRIPEGPFGIQPDEIITITCQEGNSERFQNRLLGLVGEYCPHLVDENGEIAPLEIVFRREKPQSQMLRESTKVSDGITWFGALLPLVLTFTLTNMMKIDSKIMASFKTIGVGASVGLVVSGIGIGYRKRRQVNKYFELKKQLESLENHLTRE